MFVCECVCEHLHGTSEVSGGSFERKAGFYFGVWSTLVVMGVSVLWLRHCTVK